MTLHSPESVGFVSGAGSGIARVIAHQLCADGIQKLAIVDINKPGMEETLEMLKVAYPATKCIGVHADLSKEEEATGAIEATVKEFGRLDFCVNAAGIQGPFRPTAEQTTADYDRVLGVDLRALFFCERAQIQQFMKQELRPLITMPQFTTRGAIVNISSVLSVVAMPGCSPYNMAKHGVVGLTKSDALDYGEHGIRVVAVAPGFCRNGGTVKAASNLVDSAGWDAIDPVHAGTPMRRMGTLEEIAYTVSFLGCDRSSFTTGINVCIDGGFLTK